MAKYLIDLRFPVEGEFATPEEALNYLVNGFQDALKGTTFVVLGIKPVADRTPPRTVVQDEVDAAYTGE
jgi:hypothetical protein